MTLMGKMERRIRLSAVVLLLALAIEAGSLLFVHALAFVAGVVLAGALLLAGMGIYLFALVSLPGEP